MFAFANKDGGMGRLEDDQKKKKKMKRKRIQFELDLGKEKKELFEIKREN